MTQTLALVLTVALLSCTGAAVKDPTPITPKPVVQFKPVVIDGNKVAIETIKAFMLDYQAATHDNTLTVGETVTVIFDTTETALKASEVWDKVVTKDNRTVGQIFQILRLIIEAGFQAGNFWDYELFNPDTPNIEFGNGLATMVTSTILDLLNKGEVTVANVVDFPVKVTSFVLHELKLWDKPLSDKITTTVGETFNLAVTTLKLVLTTFEVEDLVLIIIKEPVDVKLEDLDNDGVPNEDDNCLFTPNPGQEITEGVPVGDACPYERTYVEARETLSLF